MISSVIELTSAVINLANEVFGFNGWSSSIVSLQTDYVSYIDHPPPTADILQLDLNKEGRCSVNVTAIVRISLADGAWHEDVGCGQAENIKGKGAALDKVHQLECPPLVHELIRAGKEGSGHRCDQAGAADVRERAWQLYVRPRVYEGSGEDEG